MKNLIILLLLTAQILSAKEFTILFLGDSLTEGYGLNKQDAYPALVKKHIETDLKRSVTIINGGVSGSTTSDANSRLKWYLRKSPDIIFIALGTNDGLRGLNLSESEKNLEKIVTSALKSNAKVLMAGMLIPPNYGPEYSQKFQKIYENIKTKYKIRTMPFLLKDVAGEKALNQSDGIHPNVQGQKIVAKNVYEFIKEDL